MLDWVLSIRYLHEAHFIWSFGWSIYKYTGQKSYNPPANHMLSTSKNVLFPGHNHLLTISADDPSLWLSPEHQLVDSGFLALCIHWCNVWGKKDIWMSCRNSECPVSSLNKPWCKIGSRCCAVVEMSPFIPNKIYLYQIVTNWYWLMTLWQPYNQWCLAMMINWPTLYHIKNLSPSMGMIFFCSSSSLFWFN